MRFSPHALMHIVGQTQRPGRHMAGASMVLLDCLVGRAGSAGAGRQRHHRSSLAAPSFVYDMIAATGGEAAALPALRTVRCVGTTVPKQLVSQVSDVFGARLLSGWGMTEIGTGTRDSQR